MHSCVLRDEHHAPGSQAKLLSSLGLHHAGTSLRTKGNELQRAVFIQTNIL